MKGTILAGAAACGLLVAVFLSAQQPQFTPGLVPAPAPCPDLGAIFFNSAASTPGCDPSKFFWDGINHRLGIGTASPAFPLQVLGSTNVELARIGDATSGSIGFGSHSPNGGGGTIFSNGGAALNFNGQQGVPVVTWGSAVNAVAFSATPNFNVGAGNVQTITLTGNITSWTITNIPSGGTISFIVCQDGVGSKTMASPPATVHGFMTIGSTASLCSAQSFVSSGSALYATGAGSTNE